MVTDYGIAVTTPPTNKKRAKLKMNNSDLAKAKEKADKLRVKVLNDFTCNGKMYDWSNIILLGYFIISATNNMFLL